MGLFEPLSPNPAAPLGWLEEKMRSRGDRLFGSRPRDARLILDATSQHRGLESFAGYNRFGSLRVGIALDWFRLWADQFSPRVQAAIAAGQPVHALSGSQALDLIARAIEDDEMEARHARHA